MDRRPWERYWQRGISYTKLRRVRCVSCEQFPRSLCNMCLLELFSGAGGVGKVFRENGWEVFSFEIDPKAEPTLGKDMLHVARSGLPEHVDAAGASPLCTQYSIAHTRAKTPRNLVGADNLVLKTRDIISWYPCVPFVIENPQGLLKHRAAIQGMPCFTVDYCQYRDDRWPQLYRTRTHLWSNCSFRPRPRCDPQTCTCSHNGKHLARAPFLHANSEGVKLKHLGTKTLYTIPPGLVQAVYECVRMV